MLTGALAKLMNLLNFRKNLPPVIRELYRPMLYLSLGLHWAILIVPLPEETPSVAEAETPVVEEQVKLSQLLAPTTKPSPSPTPKVSPATPAPTPKTVTQPPPPVPPKAIATVAEPVVEEEKELVPEVEETATPEVEVTPTPEAEASPIQETAIATVEATPTPEAEAKPEEVAAAFQSVFGDVDANPDELVDANLFAQPEFFFTPDSLNLDGDPVKQAGINRIQWVSLKKPDRVMEEMLEPDLQSSGIAVVSQGEYGGGTVYELNKDGTVLGYLNLVPTKGSIGTMIVVWNRNPNLSVE